MTITAMRPSTLSGLGLGSVHDLVRNGSPVAAADLVDQVFGPPTDRGAFVVSGANGIVGAGKIMQLGSRLEPFGVPIAALDFPGVPDGIGAKYPGLVSAFGADRAAAIMGNVVRLSYDGQNLPSQLASLNPRFLLEAVPENLEIKRAHYEVFRSAFPEIEIRSVTSGFPQSALGVGVAHPAFPHEINKIFEIVEPEPSAITQLLWSLGLIPMAVGDQWSFVLDVLFCGLTLAGTRYHEATNMPFWKIDKFVRRLLGPNPFRAHDAIGARGANFLTWSCLHHLEQHYGAVFSPSEVLEEHKESGANWYPMNHFRPLVNWPLDDPSELETWVLGPLFQMASLMVEEERSHLAQINAIGELCAQFNRGILAVIRARGADAAIETVERYHQLHPEAAEGAWHPGAFARIETPEWQQLYVNAEHDGSVGVISLSRESYNHDVDAELNRAIDWLSAENIDRVILTGDFHLATQMVGADTSDFYPAMTDEAAGVAVAADWSRTARRLYTDFRESVGLINGKRCLGGMAELLMHCHWLVAVDGARLGMPEVTLPVVPGMEGCHWPFRRTSSESWPRLLTVLLEGRQIEAGDAVGWLVDYAGGHDDALKVAYTVAAGLDHGLQRRGLEEGPLDGVTATVGEMAAASSPGMEAGRKAIVETIRAATGATLAEALEIQAKHSGGFMTSDACRRGIIGIAWKKTVLV
jgi:enoyl-CoA hydratase/carnithine racemase/3-hydroxyacyl-CoA dehydrogenase